MELKEQKVYDYAIIGAGAAGLHLALAMNNDPFFVDKHILIVDSNKTVEKTWCFWEKGPGKWDDIIAAKWNNGRYLSSNHAIELGMGDYQYKMLRSEEFIGFAKKRLTNKLQFAWQTDDIERIAILDDRAELVGQDVSYYAEHVFDSRVEQDGRLRERSISLSQHFLGWEIETEEEYNAWDPESFTMMDFRYKWKESTSFTYVLPLSANKALIEFTLFNQELLQEEQYEEMLRTYVEDELGIKAYRIEKKEKGVIPMTTYPFHVHHDVRITKIGTGGGWVKPSTGYSFKNAERYSAKMVQNIVSGKKPSKGIARGRHRYYDRLFLDLLERHNDWGEDLFDTMYTKNPTERIFRFLDEETSFRDDLRVMSTYDPWPFIAAIIRSLRNR